MSTPAPSSSRAQLVGVLTIVATLASWTSIPLFLKHFTTHIDGWTANGWRYGASALIWLPALFVAYARNRVPPGLWRAALIPSLFNAIAQACFGLAPYHVDPGLMTFSLRFQIVFVALGAAIMFAPERRVIRSPLFILGLLLVVGGTMATLAFKPGGLGSGTRLGVALSVASGLFYAGYALSVRRWMVHMPPITAFAAVSQYTALLLILPMFFLGGGGGYLIGGGEALNLSGGRMALLILSAIIGIGIGHTLYFFSIGRLGLAVSAGVVQLQPITVSIASLFLFGERLTPLQWTTGIAAIAGAAVMLYAQQRLRRAEGAPVARPPAAKPQPAAALHAPLPPPSPPPRA